MPTAENGSDLAEPRIAIALATWNGAAYLEEQLASLATQSVCAHVVVGDDGSSDATLDILDAWKSRLPGGMTLLPNRSERLGAAGNFARILSACDADWVACCDQDDVWDHDHLAVLLQAGEALSTSRPRLVVGDLTVVDEHLHPLHPSFRAFQGFDSALGAELRCVAVMNTFPGCAMLADRELLRAALPLPPEAEMHDWWLALNAAALGQIAIVSRSIGRYRLHGSNTLGAQRYALTERIRANLKARGRTHDAVVVAARQAQALLIKHGNVIEPERRRLLATTAALYGASWLRRRWLLATGGLRRHPLARHLQFILRG